MVWKLLKEFSVIKGSRNLRLLWKSQVRNSTRQNRTSERWYLYNMDGPRRRPWYV